ncbi:rolling circle replication-associated protein [Brevibacillus laterosporus]|uniref:rolling circle replication-associated protein n=1 Tax=Brevibacillus laterosporus TaxID=1465 RepID=UPI00264DD5FD|nr:protein Rep [Brevibacillus laterosporus]MDN9012875.1 protein Rep [Brevibacillus laterosporus]MDO0943989.1 protein Rep [Brevibacillus laterosporus]
MPNHKCSNMRLIIAGDIIRLRKYENPVYSGFTRRRYVSAEEESFTSDLVADLDKVIDNEKDKMDKSLDSRARSNKRARREVINLVNANFNRHSKFITLTYEENMQDVEEARKHFDIFIKRMRRKYGGFKYIVVMEFQERGAVHYHMMSDLPYVPKKTLGEIWGHGYVKINAIDHVDNVGAYISKYMTKAEADIRMIKKKCYTTSRNMTKPIVLTNPWEIATFIRQNDLKVDTSVEDKKRVFTSSYTSEHYGKIIDIEFNLEPNHEYRLN